MASASDIRCSAAAACLMAVVMMLVVHLVEPSEGSIFRPEFESQEEVPVTFQETRPNTVQGVNKEEVKRELLRQLRILQEAEENILSKIRQLEAERRALTSRKRSHYNSMCMFNVVACYRK